MDVAEIPSLSVKIVRRLELRIPIGIPLTLSSMETILSAIGPVTADEDSSIWTRRGKQGTRSSLYRPVVGPTKQ